MFYIGEIFGDGSVRKGLLVFAFASGLAGCGGGFVHDEKLDESYRRIAVDVREGMIVCRRFGDWDCVGDELPGPTVFAAGASRLHVVIARHPGNDRSVTEYYYVKRHGDDVPLHTGDVVGPLTLAEFQFAQRRLGLPGFSRIFTDLE